MHQKSVQDKKSIVLTCRCALRAYFIYHELSLSLLPPVHCSLGPASATLRPSWSRGWDETTSVEPRPVVWQIDGRAARIEEALPVNSTLFKFIAAIM